ncbi:MAG TPA: acetate uptake transporter [Candidatus Ozemobacteraceae bacterium]|nr:acetate uptake transporter [Candidatus Ozemobacteraceae bacterium]
MSTETIIKDTTANPAPLGLIGFGMTTILLNIHNAGFYPNNSMIFAMGIFVGGIAQIIAGTLESKKNNTFGTTAFTAYGSFWLSLVAIWVLPKLGVADATDESAMGFYLATWGLFSFGMFIGTFRLNRALQVVFGTLVILFGLLAIADFTHSAAIKTIAGYEGIFCGLSACYTAIAQVLNELYGSVLMPIGPAARPSVAPAAPKES